MKLRLRFQFLIYVLILSTSLFFLNLANALDLSTQQQDYVLWALADLQSPEDCKVVKYKEDNNGPLLEKSFCFLGTSTNALYRSIQIPKKTQKLTVAIIGGAINFEHEDLKGLQCIDSQTQKPLGWNFIAKKDGSTLEFAPEFLASRTFALREKQKTSPLTQAEALELTENTSKYQSNLDYLQEELIRLESYVAAYELLTQAGLKSFTPQDIINFKPEASLPNQKKLELTEAQELLVTEAFPSRLTHLDNIQWRIGYIKKRLQFSMGFYPDNLGLEAPTFKTDIYQEIAQEKGISGSSIFNLSSNYHSVDTAYAGTIGAHRDNLKGILGQASNVCLMPLQVLPFSGSARNQDIAHAIRYAIRNKAKIIQISFNPPYFNYSQEVLTAIQEALSKDILFVRGAGDHGSQIHELKELSFANTQWLEVGASSMTLAANLIHSHSNYGHGIDFFAPGEQIVSTDQAGNYSGFSGTQMAASQTTGVAALIWDLFPKLTASQLKQVLMESVVRLPMFPVFSPEVLRKQQQEGLDANSIKNYLTPFGLYSKTGGVLNANQAYLRAKALSEAPLPRSTQSSEK